MDVEAQANHFLRCLQEYKKDKWNENARANLVGVAYELAHDLSELIDRIDKEDTYRSEHPQLGR